MKVSLEEIKVEGSRISKEQANSYHRPKYNKQCAHIYLGSRKCRKHLWWKNMVGKLRRRYWTAKEFKKYTPAKLWITMKKLVATSSICNGQVKPLVKYKCREAYRFCLLVESFEPWLENCSCVIFPLGQGLSSNL